MNNQTALAPQHPARQRIFGSSRAVGLIMVLIGSTFWGLSGTASQQLFQGGGFSPAWLVSVRMGVTGLILLLIVSLKTGRRQTLDVWRHPSSRIKIVVFGVVGLCGVQYTYMASIQLGNAATATFLQYLAPAFILVYLAVLSRKSPTRREYVALLFALAGTFLLVSNGSVHTIVVPLSAVTWGLLSAVALAFYTLYPQPLIMRHGSAATIGWAMLIGGVAMALYSPPWHTAGQHWSVQNACLVAFVVLFGTLIAFYLYLGSMKYIRPAETSLVSSFEPLSAAAASVLYLHTTLGLATIVGGLCILAIIVILSASGRA